MTYNWNTMVDITVPTGTNGWLYSGEVIINGIKVRFPVGVPTSVPEPAAVLLKKMIELEQEEADNTAKPDNHYVGSVTIPDGKVLKLDKGAKVEDPDGILGSAPAEVVILPETELEPMQITPGEGGEYTLSTAPENSPVGGGMYKIVWGGVEYTSKAIDLTDKYGAPAFAFGNVSIMGAPDDVENPDPTAPYLIQLLPGGYTEDGITAYGVMMSVGIIPDPPVLSIVQTEGGSGAGNGLFTVKAITTDGSTVTVDKTYEEITAAVDAGKFGFCYLDLMGTQTLYLPLAARTRTSFAFSAHVPNADAAVTVKSDGTSELKFSITA